MPIKGSSLEDKEFDEFEQYKPVSENEIKFRQYIAQQLLDALDAGKLGAEDYARAMLILNSTDDPEKLVDKVGIEKPMFFETEHGNLVNISYIIAFVSKDSFLNVKDAIGAKLSEKDIERFKRFAKIHGVFGKEM